MTDRPIAATQSTSPAHPKTGAAFASGGHTMPTKLPKPGYLPKPGWLGDRIGRKNVGEQRSLMRRGIPHIMAPPMLPTCNLVFRDGVPPHGGTRRTERAARIKAATRRQRAGYAPLPRGRGKAGRERTHRRKRATPISCACVLARAASASAPDWHGAARSTQIDRSNERPARAFGLRVLYSRVLAGTPRPSAHSLERAAAGRRLRAVVTQGRRILAAGGRGARLEACLRAALCMLACRALHACLPRPCGAASPRRRGATHRRAA